MTKVVKGGKIMGFRCTAVIGNQNGLVGVGCRAGREVAIAVKVSREPIDRSIESMEGLAHQTMELELEMIQRRLTSRRHPFAEGPGGRKEEHSARALGRIGNNPPQEPVKVSRREGDDHRPRL